MKSLINFYTQTEFNLEDKISHKNWLEAVAESEGKTIGHLSYVFCMDNELLKMNREYLNHDTLTDIITFDYTEDNCISAEIYISVDRVQDNAKDFDVAFEEELRRVMVHGLLHCCGYEDSSDQLKAEMRILETKKMKLFHVEHN